MNTSIYDRNIKNLNLIPENKTRQPLDKELLLAEKPYTKVHSYGMWGGDWVSYIRLTYSPINGPRYTSDDESKARFAIGEIARRASIRQQRKILICGGEPLYKFDDEVRHLLPAIRDLKSDAIIGIETTGVVVPNFIHDWLDRKTDTSIDYVADHYMIRPSIFSNPVPENEYSPYIIFMKENIKKWIEFLGVVKQDKWEYVIDIYSDDFGSIANFREEIEKNLFFLEENTSLIPNFTFVIHYSTDSLYRNKYINFIESLSEYYINFMHAGVKVLDIPSSVLIERSY